MLHTGECGVRLYLFGCVCPERLAEETKTAPHFCIYIRIGGALYANTKFMKKFLSLLFTTCALCLITSCGNETSSNSSSSPVENTSITNKPYDYDLNKQRVCERCGKTYTQADSFTDVSGDYTIYSADDKHCARCNMEITKIIKKGRENYNKTRRP